MELAEWAEESRLMESFRFMCATATDYDRWMPYSRLFDYELKNGSGLDFKKQTPGNKNFAPHM